MFSSKCHINAIKHIQNFTKDQKFIKTLRNIKLGDSTKKQNCPYILNKSYISTHSFNTKYKNLYRHYKKKYKKEGHNAYKHIYKYIKNKLV